MIEIARPTADPARISALHRRCFDAPWDIAETLRSPGTFALVIARCGFVLGRIAADECEILSIGVVPEARRRGFGTRLVTAACDHARDRGAARVFLEAAEDNAAARHLYTGAGFTTAGRRPRYYGPETDALILALEI